MYLYLNLPALFCLDVPSKQSAELFVAVFGEISKVLSSVLRGVEIGVLQTIEVEGVCSWLLPVIDHNSFHLIYSQRCNDLQRTDLTL